MSMVPAPASTGGHTAVLDGLREVLRSATVFCLDLHGHPELSGEEEHTADRLAARLDGDGFTVARGVGGHGVVGVLRNGPGPVVMVRAELDALPGQERTGLPYASRLPVMHACGHDLHTAAAAGAATLLARARDHWRGTLLVVGQPAEETLSGARAMLQDGLYERFGCPEAVLAQHTAPLPGGMGAHSAGHGPMMGGSVGLEVAIHGRSGHAATPHLAVDPVVAAAATVMRLQTVVARETAPAEQVVVTVGSLHAGSRGNVVPDLARMSITVRGLSEAALDRAAAAVERIVRAECDASRCERAPEITTVSRSPVMSPDPAAASAVRRAHTELFGPERVADWPSSMATEDFPLFGDAGLDVHGRPGIPLVYWMLGCVGPRQWARAGGASAAEKPAVLPPNHSPEFAPDVRTALPTGISAMATAALTRLGHPPAA